MNDTAYIDGDGKKVFRYEQVSDWVQVEFKQLKKGEKFRIYSQDGMPILIDGQEIFWAVSDAHQIEGKWKVKVNLANNNLNLKIHTPKWFSGDQG